MLSSVLAKRDMAAELRSRKLRMSAGVEVVDSASLPCLHHVGSEVATAVLIRKEVKPDE
jgi:hypothetical protein